ncbi:MAG: hypothetical protein AB7V45_17555 [Candidatus Krumholzibacteriia bacterium]
MRYAKDEMSEKRDLEKAALREFGIALAQAGLGNFEVHEMLEPPAPDALCSLNGKEVFVEVAHVYGTETDAKLLLGRQGRSAGDPEEHKRDALRELGSRVIGPLNKLLATKARKTYARAPVWLLIRSGSPLLEYADYATWYRDEITVPADGPFEEIWLLCGPLASSGALRLA